MAIFLAVQVAPVMADSGEKCRIFVPNDKVAEVQKLRGNEFTVLPLSDEPNVLQMPVLYDLAIFPDWRKHWGVWMTLSTTTGPAEIGYVSGDDLHNLPHCWQKAEYAKIGYFRSVFGAQARERLDSYYVNKFSRPGLGHLILQAELLMDKGFENFQQSYGPIADNYDRLIDQTKRLWQSTKGRSLINRVDELRRFLNPVYREYYSMNASMTAMLHDQIGGNCEANTKALTAILVDAQIDFGPDYTLGVQLFEDHLQPVLLDIKTGTLINFLSGDIETHPGLVYAPEILSYGIARLAGRTVDSEREFGLKLKGVRIQDMDLRLGLMDFLQAPGMEMGSELGAKTIFKLGRGETYYAKNQPNPLRAQIDFKPIDPSAYAGSGMGKMNLSRLQNPDCLINGQPVKESDLNTINEKLWSQIPSAERPAFSDQKAFTCAHLPYSKNGPDVAQNILVLPYTRLAASEELNFIPEDLPFGLTPKVSVPEVELMVINETRIYIRYPKQQVIFSSRGDLENYTRGVKDPLYWDYELRNLLENRLVRKVAGVDIDKLVQIVQHSEVLFSEPVPGLLGGMSDLASAIQFNDDFYFATGISIDTDKHLGVFCALSASLKEFSDFLFAHPEDYLKLIDRQDIVGHLRFFKVFAELSYYYRSIGRSLYRCSVQEDHKNPYLDLKFPLRGLFNYVVLHSLNRSQLEIKALPPRIVTQVTLVPTMDNAPSNQLKAQTGKNEPERMGVDENLLRLTAKPNSSLEKKFEVRSETLLGLLMNIKDEDAQNPIVKALALTWWSEELETYFRQGWADKEFAQKRLADIWHWSSFESITDWMNFGLQGPFVEAMARPGRFIIIQSHEHPVYIARVPRYLEGDLTSALDRFYPDRQWSWQLTPPRPSPDFTVTKSPSAFEKVCSDISSAFGNRESSEEDGGLSSESPLTKSSIDLYWSLGDDNCTDGEYRPHKEQLMVLIQDADQQTFTFNQQILNRDSNHILKMNETVHRSELNQWVKAPAGP